MADPKPEAASPAPAIEEIWPRISARLDEVLALAPEQRRAWLDDLGRADPEAAQQLESCLADLEHLRGDEFLTGESPASPFATTLAGQRIGAYTLERCLGYGGMGAVWLARRDDGRFEGHVAVKLLNAALIGHPTEQRFTREGTLLARLKHPNIAHLVDAGIAAGGQPYLVLEYVAGERIDRYCELHAPTLEQRLALFLSVLDAVSHAHRNLIVHRDLKPANILVTADGRAKLLDFGVAALLEPDQPGGELTRQAPPGLTVAWAAPEQLRGGTVTTATDVYALGLILYLLLTDQAPVVTDGKTATEVMQAVLEADVPSPSKVTAQAGRRRLLAGDLDNIVAMSLRKDPTQRYTSVEAFAQDLRHSLANEPVMARPDSLGYRAGKFVRRHRGGVAAALLVLLSLAGTAIVTGTLMAEARKQRDQARFESRRAEMVSDFMGVLLMSGGGGADRPVLSEPQRLERGVELLEKQYGSDPRFLGLMLVQLANQYRGTVETRRANELYQRAYEIGRSIDDPRVTLTAQCSRAYANTLAGIDEGVSERLGEAQQLMQRSSQADATVRATCLLASAQLEIHASRPQAAESLLREAMRAIESEGSEHRPIYVKAITDLGGVYLANNQPAAALRMAELAGAVHERNGRGDTSTRLVARQNAAISLSAMGETRRALEQYEMVLRRLRELEPQGHEPTYYAVNYGSLLLSMQRPQEALNVVEPVLPRARSSGPKSLIQALRVYGVALAMLGRVEEASASADEAALAAPKADRGTQAFVEVFRTEVALQRGDVAAAEEHSRAALEFAGYGTERAERQLNRALLTAASVALRAGAITDAEKYAEAALHRTESLARGVDTSADVGEALLLLAKTKLARGSTTEAKPLLTRAVRCLENALDKQHPLAVEARQLLSA